MSHLKSETTCQNCPLFDLSKADRSTADIKFSWGVSPRESAIEAIQNGANQDEVITSLGYEYRATSPLAVAIATCAFRQVITKDCSFS